MKQIMAPIPSPFKALFGWLHRLFGVSVMGRLNFERGFYVGGVHVTPELMRELNEMVGGNTSRKRSPNVKSRDAPVKEDSAMKE